MSTGRTGTAAAFLGGRDGGFFFKKKNQQKTGTCQEKKKKSSIFSIMSWLWKWGYDSHGKWEGLGNMPGCK